MQGDQEQAAVGQNPARPDYRCPEDLCVLNELNDPCWVLTLEPSNSKTFWCNEAASRNFHNLDLAAEREGEVEVLMDQWYRDVQVSEKVLEFRKTFYPGGVPITMDCVLKPVRIRLRDTPQQSQTAMMVIGRKLEIVDARAEEVNRAHEMLGSMKTHAMLFARDGTLIASNPNADNYYRHRDVGIPLNLRGIFQTMAWQNPDDLEAEYQKVISLCSKRAPDEYVIEAERVPLAGSTRADDEERWHLLRFLVSVDPETGRPAILATETDISQVKMQMRLQENFFATLCHELRTPLTGIIGLTDSILKDREMLPSDIEKKIDIIKSGGKRLANLVCDIMDAASLREQRLVVKQEHVNLPEVSNNVMQMLSPILRKGVQLQNRVDPNLPSIVGDTNRIEQILTNLVGNSAKFTSKGHICISAFQIDNDHVAIEVADTGIGIPQDKIGTIFGRFQQVDLATTRKYGGTGLGLSLVKSLVQAHNGRITVSSRMGKEDHGSTFTVILPIDSGAPDQNLEDSNAMFSDPRPSAMEPMSYDNMQEEEKAQLAQANRELALRLQHQDRRVEELEAMLHGARMHGLHDGSERGSDVGRSYMYRQQNSLKWRDEDSDSYNRRSHSRDAWQGMGTSMRSVLDDEDMPLFQNHSDLNDGVFEVLSVDDDPVNQMVIEGLLAPKGYVVTACLDGDEALTLLDERGFLPDVILLDCQMPGKTGFEVCLELRQQYPETLPVIMISANTEEENILKGFQVGSNDYVKKPFNGAEVLARIQTQLRLRDMWKAEVDATRSQELLNKMLPPHIMNKLKGGDCTMIAESHENVTILFSDIVGFTTIAAQYKTKEIIVMLNEMFTEFDLLTVKHGVYKVQTIGDAYMIAAGHDEESRHDHYRRVFDFARDMLEVIQKVMLPDESDSLKIRVGIHSGPAYAGIVGVKCPRYCFFGDTVNTASRMESNGFPMTIHVSGQTYRLLSNECGWIDCGERMIKGKGVMNTYLAKLGDWPKALEIHQKQLEAAAEEEKLRRMGYTDPKRLMRINEQEKELAAREAHLMQEEKRIRHELGVAEQNRREAERLVHNHQNGDGPNGHSAPLQMQKEALKQEIRELELSRDRLRTHAEHNQDEFSTMGNGTNGKIPSEDSAFSSSQGTVLEKAKKSLTAAQEQVIRLREDKAQLQSQLESVLANREEFRRVPTNGRGHSMMLDVSHTNGHLGKSLDSPTASSVGNRSVFQREGSHNRTVELSDMQKWLVEAVSSPDWYWAGSAGAQNDYEVALLLKHLGLQHYAQSLISEEVFTMSVLADMDEASLEKIGIRTKASRLRILDGAKCIKQAVDLIRTPEPSTRKSGDRMETPISHRSREFDSVSVPGAGNGHLW